MRVLALAGLLLLAPAADAATVRAERTGQFTVVAAFVAAPGEANRVTVTPGTDAAGASSYYESVTFADSGAVVHAGDGCRQRTPHVAVCTELSGFTSVETDLGDRADAYSVRNQRDDPGPARDRLRCGPDHDEVSRPERGETLPESCETASFVIGAPLYLDVTPTPATYGDETAPAFYVGCPYDGSEEEQPPCSGVLELRHRGRMLGRGTFASVTGQPCCRVGPVYTRRARRLAGRPRGVRTNARVTVNGHVVTWTFRLRLSR